MIQNQSAAIRIWIALSIAALGAAAASADTISIIPVADAFCNGAQPANNFGAAGSLSVTAPGSALGEFQSVLRFDFTPVVSQFNTNFGVGGWAISEITIKLTSTPPNNPIFNQPVAGQFHIRWLENDTWSEGSGTPNAPTTDGVTFDSLPAYVGPNDEDLGTFNFVGGSSGSAAYTLALTPHLLSDALAGGLVSFHIDSADLVVSYQFNSRSFGVVDSRPTLTITAIAAAPCIGDANNDRHVDLSDLALALSEYGATGPGLAADFNHDNVVNLQDLSALLANFGATCP